MFVTFEGIEGSGKSSIIKHVRTMLEEQGYNVLVTMEPGGSRLGVKLRRILLDLASRDLTREAELFLYMADRAQHVATIIRPALEAGTVVLSDRFADSTVVYQGYGRGLDPKLLHTFNEVAVAGCWPDLTVLLDLPAEMGLKRAVSRNLREGKADSEGRFEAESLAFHEKVREGYLTWASLYNKRYRVVDASAPLAVVQAATWEVVAQNLANKGNGDSGPVKQTIL